LIQGPPGTGKTSVILSNLISYYSENEKNIYLIAYTNRAIENISLVLQKLGLNYLRLGTKESTDDENLLANLISNKSHQEVYKYINECKIVLGTLSSIVSNQEIFSLVQPEICLVDEAAQILEAHLIGVVSKFEKFILIGDEKQLPAITIQDEKFYKVEDLNQIELNALNQSLFERLLRLNKKAGNEAYGLLQKQGRMCDNIMKLASELFYQNKLLAFKKTEIKLPLPFTKNVLFIDSKQEKNFKQNHTELEIVSSIIDKLLELGYSEEDIGIISPFRLQCSNIRNSLLAKGINCDVDTVERFQGSERKVIIYSFAINRIGDLKNIISPVEIDKQIIDRKLNVAITRAKELLVIIGNIDILSLSIYNFIDFFIMQN
jgi:DNA replication ATP-dependent helicase Dna2